MEEKRVKCIYLKQNEDRPSSVNEWLTTMTKRECTGENCSLYAECWGEDDTDKSA